MVPGAAASPRSTHRQLDPNVQDVLRRVAAAVHSEPHVTIRGAPRDTAPLALDELPIIPIVPILDAATESAETPRTPGALRTLNVLGRGGTGVVHAARQEALARTVAVKTLDGPPDDESALALLQEARVTGRLEHPNIVPVHLLGRSEGGVPLFVMKRIEGVSLRALLDGRGAHAGLTAAEDPLAWHLDVFDQLLNAVAFAHSSGVLHLDIKAENVMVGSYGEVYLMDWGVALLADAEGGWSLRPGILVGTPEYIAPEMACLRGGSIGPTTDIYLLGGTLLHILSGRPPHSGDTVLAALMHATSGELPELALDLDPDLRAAVLRALDPDPSARYVSARELQRDLHELRSHRASRQLAAISAKRLPQLEQTGTVGSEADMLARIAFAECRFGFEQALTLWPDNPAARMGLNRAFEAMIRRLLESREVSGAKALSLEMPDPPQSLRNAVEAAVASDSAMHARVQQLEAIVQEGDFSVGGRARLFFLMLIASMTIIIGLTIGALIRAHPSLQYVLFNGCMGLGLLMVAIYGVTTRHEQLATVANRSIFAASASATLLSLVAGIMGALLDLPLYATCATSAWFLSLTSTTLAAAYEPRIFFTSLIMFLGGIACALVPRYAVDVLMIAYAATALVAAWAWSHAFKKRAG